jgi:hypothetical protein
MSGAANVLEFYIWLIFLVSCSLLHPTVWVEMARNTSSFPSRRQRIIDAVYDVVVIMVLVWNGWFFVGTLYLLHMGFLHVAFTLAEGHIFNVIKGNE